MTMTSMNSGSSVAARYFVLVAASIGLALCAPATAQVTLTEGTNFTLAVSDDGRIAIDLLGGIWVLPATGGAAQPIRTGPLPVRRPHWSPGSTALVFEAHSPQRSELQVYDFATQSVRALGDGHHSDRDPDWHPGGDRVVFASQRGDSGLDLWEIDLPTGLSWRISSLPGDETEPAWSADGRDLVYVHELAGRWSLMLRRFGQPDRELIGSEQRLAAPSWRPDGSLISFARESADGLTIDMVILAEPLLERTLIDDHDLFEAPVAWSGRQQMLYAANGVIRERRFNSWTSRTVPFRATIGQPQAQSTRATTVRELPVTDAPEGRLVLRAARLFDGIDGRYREGLDIVVDGAYISAVEQRGDHPGAIVVDMGDLTVLPGFIDSYATLPPDADEAIGPLLLACGVTTLVAEHPDAAALNERWAGKTMPGPRLLPAGTVAAESGSAPFLVTLGGDMNAGLQHRDEVDQWQRQGIPVLAETWQAGLGSGAAMLLGAATLPASPGGHRYQDIELGNAAGQPVTIISGLADAQTPHLKQLLASRQAALLGQREMPARRFASPPLVGARATVVVGSAPNGLGPGLGLQAELRALAAAGLRNEQVLRAAGVNAATALGLGLRVGRIATGAVADLVIVDGDPLANIDDALKVVGVVRNGRFFSTIGLIERRDEKPGVE